MALNRGSRRINLPIAGDVARYGKIGVGENVFTTFGNIGKEVAEEIQSNRIKDFELKEVSHANYLNNLKLEKDKDKLYQDELKKINDAKFNNAINKTTSRINIDINNALTNFEIEYKNPADYNNNVSSWVKGYIKDNDLKPFVDQNGEIVFDPKNYIIEKVSVASNPVYKNLVNEQNKNNSNNSLELYKYDLDTSFGKGFSNFSNLIENINEENYATFFDDLTTIYNPIELAYTNYIGKLQNLKEQYPYTFSDEKFVENESKKYQKILTEQVVGQISKLNLDASNRENLEKSNLSAKQFIQDWYNNQFNENSDDVFKIIASRFTKDAKDFSLEDKDAIKINAESILNERYEFLSADLNINNSRSNAEKKAAKKNILLSSENILAPEIPEEFIDEIYSSYSQSGGYSFDEQSEIVKTKQNTKLNLKKDFNNLFIGEKDFIEILNDPLYKDYGKNKIVEDLYKYLNSGNIDVNNFVNVLNKSAAEGYDLSNDSTYTAFSAALNITNQYPQSFVDYANSLMSANYQNKSAQDKLYNFLSALNTYNEIETYNLDPKFVMAAKKSLNTLQGSNDETDILQMVEYFDGYVNKKTKDKIENIESEFVNTANIWFGGYLQSIDPSVLNNFLDNVLPFQQGLSYVPVGTTFKDIDKDSTLYRSIPNSLLTTIQGNLQDTLKQNEIILKNLVTTEAVRLASEIEHSYLGANKEDEREGLMITAFQNVIKEISTDGWRIDPLLYNVDDPDGNYSVLTPYSILYHGNIKKLEDLKYETNHQLRMIFNAMTPAERIDFFETENYQEEYIDNLDEMFDSGKIKFKFDQRSALTNKYRWTIMMNKKVGQYNMWEELEVFDPNGEKVSWSPTNSVSPTSKASQKYVKDQMKNKIKNQMLENFSPQYREEGKILATDDALFGMMADLTILALDNYKEFTDKFSDFKDFDTIKELANRNQAEYAVEKQNQKNKVEILSENYTVNEFSTIIQSYDLPMTPVKNNEYYVYDSYQVDDNLNEQKYLAIGPGLPIELNGKINPDIKKILENNNYNEKDLRNIITGEMGINRDTYEQLGVYKYKLATKAYEEIYDEVILTPRNRNVLIDIIASVGIDLVGPNSKIYKYIYEGNMNMAKQEISKLKDYYNNKKRHSHHLIKWEIDG